MTPNQLLPALDGDEPAVGALAWLDPPTVIELCGSVNLDFVWIDLEHGGPAPTDARFLETCTRAADAAGVELVVRLPGPDPPTVRKVLDTGIRNVFVPRIESAAEARRAVAASRFQLDGEPGDRGLATVRANAWGARMDDYLETEDANVRLGVMIETQGALDELDEILSIPHLGFVFVGPWDLSHALGHPLETDHPDVVEAIRDVEARCREAGVPLMGFAPDPGSIEALVDRGHRLLVIGSDAEAITGRFGEWVDAAGR